MQAIKKIASRIGTQTVGPLVDLFCNLNAEGMKRRDIISFLTAHTTGKDAGKNIKAITTAVDIYEKVAKLVGILKVSGLDENTAWAVAGLAISQKIRRTHINPTDLKKICYDLEITIPLSVLIAKKIVHFDGAKYALDRELYRLCASRLPKRGVLYMVWGKGEQLESKILSYIKKKKMVSEKDLILKFGGGQDIFDAIDSLSEKGLIIQPKPRFYKAI